MKIIKLGILFLITTAFYSCKTDPKIDPTGGIQITSKDYIDDLLFVNSNSFQITTSEPSTFSSTDPFIKMSPTGLISRITSGEVVPIDVVSIKDPNLKKRIYALGVKDDNYDETNVSYNGLAATDAYNSYLKGWKTLQKLPVMNGTYAMIMRHADADKGRDYNTLDKGDGPANWWKSCDTTLARQLNTKGRERSVELGKIFKDLQYPITRVISSEFCRAKETATLINAGPKVITDGRINHPDYNVSGSSLFQGMLDIMKEQPVDNKMTLLEAHHPINERRSEIAGFPDVIPFPWTGGYFVKVEQDHSVTFEGAVSYPMFKYFRDKKLHRL